MCNDYKGSTYLLAEEAGEREARRLELQHTIFGPDTEKFLTGFIKPRQTILVPGCGTGEELVLISNLMKNTGKIVAVDISDAQIAEARKKIEAKQITNVEFHVLDLMNLSSISISFDVIFIRFVLIHLAEPLKAIQTLITKLKSDGWLMCEEAIMDMAYAMPECAAFNQHMDLFRRFAEAAKVDFNLGNTLAELLTRAGLVSIETNITQPIMETQSQKQIVPMSALASSKAYTAKQLTTEHEITLLVKSLYSQVVENAACKVGQVGVAHVVGRKSLKLGY